MGDQIGSTDGGSGNTQTTGDDTTNDSNGITLAEENKILNDGIVKEGLRRDEADDEERAGAGKQGGGPTILNIAASVADITDELFTDALDSAEALASKQAEISERGKDDENKSTRGATPGDTILVQAEYQLASSMSTAGSEIVKTTGNAARSGSKTS